MSGIQLSPIHTTLRSFIDSVNFGEALTDGMLSVLLFAGGLQLVRIPFTLESALTGIIAIGGSLSAVVPAFREP